MTQDAYNHQSMAADARRIQVRGLGKTFILHNQGGTRLPDPSRAVGFGDEHREVLGT